MRVASFRYETSYRWNIWSDNGGDWWKSMALIRWIMAWSRCEIEVAHDRDNACTNTFGWRFTRCNNRVDDGSNWICVKAIEVNWKQKRGGGERIDRVFFLLFPFFFFFRFIVFNEQRVFLVSSDCQLSLMASEKIAGRLRAVNEEGIPREIFGTLWKYNGRS